MLHLKYLCFFLIIIFNNLIIFRLNRGDLEHLARVIVGIFKTESISHYFIPSHLDKQAKGKLFNAYKNKRTALAEAGIIKLRTKSRKDKTNENSSDTA